MANTMDQIGYNSQKQSDPLRPGHQACRLLRFLRLSTALKAHQIFRCGNKENLCLPVQQLCLQTDRDCNPLQAPVEDRIVLQMDQTAPDDKIVLGNICQRGQDTGLDGHLH